MKDVWSLPTMKTVKALKHFQSLIPPIIKDHYASIADEGCGYHGLRREVRGMGDAKWDWQVLLPCIVHGNTTREVPI